MCGWIPTLDARGKRHTVASLPPFFVAAFCRLCVYRLSAIKNWDRRRLVRLELDWLVVR
jgi:hypothetical protein